MKKLLYIILILFLFTNVINIFIPVFAEESSSAEVSFCDRDGWVSMVDGYSGGQFNFSRLQQYPQPFVNENGRTMFPILYFDEIFRDGLSYDINDNTITITRNILDVITTVSVTIDSNVLIRNGEEIVMDTVPIRIGETIYIPLWWVADSLGYGVLWRDYQSKWWPGGMVEFGQLTSIFVYVWNEDKDSSPNGLRYSYTIGERSDDMSEIKANATSDFEDVFAVIKRLPQGATVLTTAIYGLDGYKVPYDIYNGITNAVFNGGYKGGYSTYCLDEIPPIINSLGDFTNEWYSEELSALGEPALYDSIGQIYRFSYIPSFWNPFVVRIEINDDGTADVCYKSGNGVAGPHSGGILKSESAKLSREETKEFLDLLNDKDYWNMPKEVERLGCDGYDVVIEGVKNGVYHIVNRWCPMENDPAFYIEKYFENLVKEKFPE